MLFFWVVKISMEKLEAWRFLAVDVAKKMLNPKLKALSLRRNGVLSDLNDIHSPVQKSKR